VSAPAEPPLLPLLRSLIAEQGPIPVASYMALALGHPRHGYYMTRDPFGARGDFVTAPEISQLFGECLAIWCALAWDSMKRPLPVRLVELGPGRGTLMADLTRTLDRIAPKLAAGATLHLVETSPVLRRAQESALSGRNAAWHARFDDVPEGPLLLVANEFFDALPIRQFVWTQGAWRERVVGLDTEGRLAFGIGAGRLDANLPAIIEDRAVIEIRPAAEALAGEVAGRIVKHGGAALIVDYGYEGPAVGETLQAVRWHEFEDALLSPGEADLTAHVDFSALAEAALAAGAAVHGPMAQGEFLLSLGLLERAGQLGADADEGTREALRAAVERLAGENEMGTLFKVLALTRSGIHCPPFRG
jgi:SAM-dependent MidA family methyltransferase